MDSSRSPSSQSYVSASQLPVTPPGTATPPHTTLSLSPVDLTPPTPVANSPQTNLESSLGWVSTANEPEDRAPDGLMSHRPTSFEPLSERSETPQRYTENRDIYHTHVLCIFDFESEDTPFKKNDILEVIHQEPGGWWAAQVGEHVGWIPSAFVEIIPFDMVDTLQNVSHELRCSEYEASALYGAPFIDETVLSGHDEDVAQTLQPWYLKPQRSGDEIKIHYNGSVKLGTIEALIERLTSVTFESKHILIFQHTFLMTFRTFSTAGSILELLIDCFQMETPKDLVAEQPMEWKEKKLKPTQARVLRVLTLWVEKYGLAEDDAQVISRLHDFLGLIKSPPAFAASATHILSILDRPRRFGIGMSVADPSLIAPSVGPSTRRTTPSHQNNLLRINPVELAQQLTLYGARLYVKVRPHECLTWGGTQKDDNVQDLRSFVSMSEKLAAWVKSSVLSNDVLGKRADTIELWLKVADTCRALNNYSTMSAIISALACQAISCLQLTWALVNRASLTPPSLSFLNRLTIIYIFLADMVKVSETEPGSITVPASETTLEMLLINFEKRQQMAHITHMILQHQPKVRDQYKIDEIPLVMQYLESQLELVASNDEHGFLTRSQEVQMSERAHADIQKAIVCAGF